MPRIKVNLDDIADGFEILEPGKYVAKLVECEEQDSSKGHPMLVWTWQVVDGDYQGKELKSFTSLQEHALFGLKEHLGAFGIDGEVDFDSDRLIGKRVKLTVGKSMIKNRDSGEDMEVNRITKLEKAKGGGGGGAGRNKPITDDDIPF